jgi:tetratricopeptide (TPR) repeat protein
MSADESKLQSLLNSGLGQLRKGVFGPKIRKLQHSGAGFRWSVVCDGAPIEELLARFAANAGLHIRWSSGGAPSSGQTQDIVRTRPASIYMASTTAPQFVTAAAGSVGLLSRTDDKGTVEICDPASYESLSEHIALLGHEALSLWQKFTLTFHDDKYIPNAHFAIGLLHAQRNNVTDAIAEYKLVANRFPQTSLAPLALLHSSKLRTSLNDHLGARDVLKQLVEQYPDSEVHGQACLYLADVTTKAGFPNEGGGLYQKVYNLCFSPESQVTAALGAARCYFRAEDYEVAAKWLTRYIGLVKDHTNCELYSAYMLLGKAQLALGNPEQASEALECALKGQLTKEEYTETISALVDVHMQQEQLVEALDILETVRSWEMSPKEYVEILLLKASVLRRMGLADKAVATLGEQAEYVTDQQLKAKVSLEIIRCRIAKGDLERAYKDLTKIMTFVEPGPVMDEITLELANVCLKLDQCEQAIAVCSQLLSDGPCVKMKQEALEILATAYRRRQEYDKAALALLGQWQGSESANENRITVRQSVGKAL